VGEARSIIPKIVIETDVDPWTLLSVSDPNSYEKGIIEPIPKFPWIKDLLDVDIPDDDDRTDLTEDPTEPFHFTLLD
jgi:hypothetical protein